MTISGLFRIVIISVVVANWLCGRNCSAMARVGALLVALALVEVGLSADEAIAEVRTARRGALGKHQQAIVHRHVPSSLAGARAQLSKRFQFLASWM